MPDQIIEVNPHFEEQMTDQLNKLPLLKLEYKFLDAYLINTYKELNTWFQIRENALTAWGYILFWMSYRKIYLNEFSANDLDWNLNIEGTLNYVMGISKQGWFNARNRIVENILQKRFDDYFKEFGNYQKNGLETELLEKATATFTIAFFNRFVREKSINYKAKESMRVTERKIIHFMECEIKTLPGVKNVIRKEKIVEIDVDVFEYEEFLSQFYHSIKRLAKNVDNVSFPGYLLQKNFSKLNVKIMYDEKCVFH